MPTDYARQIAELENYFDVDVARYNLAEIARALLAENAEQAELFKKAHRSTRERVAELAAETESLKASYDDLRTITDEIGTEKDRLGAENERLSDIVGGRNHHFDVERFYEDE